MKIKLLFLLIFTLQSAYAIKDGYGGSLGMVKDSVNLNKQSHSISKPSSHSDSITFSKQEFIELLEKKSSTETTLSIFITALGVLFTIMAIVVAIVIFFQSQDFKNKLNETINKYQLIVEDFINAKIQDLVSQEDELKKQISDYKKDLEKGKPLQEEKIKKIIEDLESKKKTVEKQLSDSIVNTAFNPTISPSDNLIPFNILHTCSSCGHKYYATIYPTLPKLTSKKFGLMRRTKFPTSLTCSKCGHIDKVNI